MLLMTSCADPGGNIIDTAYQAGLPLSDIEGCSGAVFRSGSRLYVYDATNGSIKEIDEAAGEKHFLGLPPGRTAEYLYSFRSEGVFPSAERIGIYDIASGRTTELVVDDSLYQLMNVFWTSDRTIMAVSHMILP